MRNQQHTYLIETDYGMTYLVVDEGMSLEETFELYKNDEAGKWAKYAKITYAKKVN